MFIVDTQVHIWKEETPDRPWIPGARERMRLNGHREEAFTYQECIDLMDKAGVDRALILPPSWEGDRIDYALEACEAHPGRFGVMARVPQNKPVEGAALMRELAVNPHVKGTRLTFHRPQDRNRARQRFHQRPGHQRQRHQHHRPQRPGLALGLQRRHRVQRPVHR